MKKKSKVKEQTQWLQNLSEIIDSFSVSFSLVMANPAIEISMDIVVVQLDYKTIVAASPGVVSQESIHVCAVNDRGDGKRQEALHAWTRQIALRAKAQQGGIIDNRLREVAKRPQSEGAGT